MDSVGKMIRPRWYYRNASYAVMTHKKKSKRAAFSVKPFLTGIVGERKREGCHGH
jgi:intein-encoded DNA endonuclease-like protein